MIYQGATTKAIVKVLGLQISSPEKKILLTDEFNSKILESVKYGQYQDSEKPSFYSGMVRRMDFNFPCIDISLFIIGPDS